VDDDAALGRIRDWCTSFPHVEEAQLQGRRLFRVRRRRFVIFNGAEAPARPRWAHFGRSVHFLADPLEVDALRSDGRFSASPHHGDRGWLALSLDGAVDWAEVGELVEAAYRQAAPRQLTDGWPGRTG
jgi:predicted DNA-binding protein (MmcQ/YjbR family)